MDKRIWLGIIIVGVLVGGYLAYKQWFETAQPVTSNGSGTTTKQDLKQSASDVFKKKK